MVPCIAGWIVMVPSAAEMTGSVRLIGYRCNPLGPPCRWLQPISRAQRPAKGDFRFMWSSYGFGQPDLISTGPPF
jgi:hypothetical protein